MYTKLYNKLTGLCLKYESCTVSAKNYCDGLFMTDNNFTSRLKTFCLFSGIGYETAKNIAFMGANVILAVRTEERGKSVSS